MSLIVCLFSALFLTESTKKRAANNDIKTYMQASLPKRDCRKSPMYINSKHHNVKLARIGEKQTIFKAVKIIQVKMDCLQ